MLRLGASMSAHTRNYPSDNHNQQHLERLTSSEKLFRTLVEKSTDIFVLLNTEGYLTYVSPAITPLLGYEPEQLLGEHALVLIHPDDLLMMQHILQDILQFPNRTAGAEYRLRHNDGTWKWFEGRGINLLHDPDVASIVGTFRDISQRKAVEVELQHSKSQLEAILKHIADGITVQDPTGKMVYANHAAAMSMGYRSVEELLAAPPLEYTQRFELSNEQGQPFALSDLPGRRAIAGEEHPQVTIKSVNRQTQEVYWAVIQSTAIRDEQRQPLLVINVMHDITFFKEQEQRKDEFIGMASHELKTPITTLKAYNHLLLRQLKNAPTQEPLMFLTRMDTQLDRLTKLIQDLLDVSKMHAGKLDYAAESVDIDTLLHEVVEMMQHSSRTHTIHLEGSSHKQIMGDSERLHQVFVNLLSNAIKYSPQSKHVDVQISSNDDTVTIKIRDYGIGIDPKYQERLFERFYRVSSPKDKTFPGLGIGLYIVREIIQRHNGTISVASDEGKGATFSVTLPTFP